MEAPHFEDWYRREHGRLLSALTVVAGDSQLAVDAADEAFARAYERWEAVRHMDSPGGWTYRTAVNVVRRKARRAGVERALLERFRGGRDDEAGRPPDWSLETWDALQRLPRRERTAVALRYIADLPTADIAQAMGVALGTIGSLLHAARRRLGIVLADPPEPADTASTAQQEATNA